MNRIIGKLSFLLPYCVVAVVVIAAWPICQAARGEEAARKDREKTEVVRRLIEGLGNKDVKMKGWIDSSRPYLIIPKTFDWELQKHIGENVEKLVAMGMDAFPELIAHLDDQRFCGYWETAEVGPIHVGPICEEIMERQVEPFHYDVHAPIIIAWVPQTLPRGKKTDWEAWWKKNKDKSLRELQIEAGEASIRILKHAKQPNAIDEDFDSWRARQIKGLERMVGKLKRSKRPMPARSGQDLHLLRQDYVQRVGGEDRYYFVSP